MNISTLAYDFSPDSLPGPQGNLILKVLADSQAVNRCGDVFAGWIALHMDQAGELTARKVANGARVVAVSLGTMNFLRPVRMGDLIEFYGQVTELGRTSIRVDVEAWIEESPVPAKLTQASLVFVAIDHQGRTRRIRDFLQDDPEEALGQA